MKAVPTSWCHISVHFRGKFHVFFIQTISPLVFWKRIIRIPSRCFAGSFSFLTEIYCRYRWVKEIDWSIKWPKSFSTQKTIVLSIDTCSTILGPTSKVSIAFINSECICSLDKYFHNECKGTWHWHWSFLQTIPYYKEWHEQRFCLWLCKKARTSVSLQHTLQRQFPQYQMGQLALQKLCLLSACDMDLIWLDLDYAIHKL